MGFRPRGMVWGHEGEIWALRQEFGSLSKPVAMKIEASPWCWQSFWFHGVLNWIALSVLCKRNSDMVGCLFLSLSLFFSLNVSLHMCYHFSKVFSHFCHF